MITHDVEQGSPEWHAARLGIPTASCFEKIITPTGERSKQYDDYINALLSELMTGHAADQFEGTEDMLRGKELEPDAVAFYEFTKGVEGLVKVGFCTDDNKTMGCSPDRLIGDDGLLEIKCPKASTHVGYIITQRLEQKYTPQVQGQLYVTGRQWCDIVSYHPEMRPVVIRVQRDEGYLGNLRIFMHQFQTEMAARKQKLYQMGYIEGAAK